MFTFDRSLPARCSLPAISILTLALADVSTAEASPQGGSLEVRVTGARSDNGQIALLVFRDAHGYPDDPRRAFRSVLAPLAQKSATLAVRDLPPGRYVVTLIHDENRNGKLDTNLFGVPTEGFGFSNNPKVGLSAPAFRACVFEVGAGQTTIEIRLRY